MGVTNHHTLNATNVIQMFDEVSLSEKARHYLNKQASRMAFVINKLSEIAAVRDKERLQVLDIAPHLMTTAIKKHFNDQIMISTLGWLDTNLTPSNILYQQVEFDLNDSNFEEKWVDAGKYDVVIFGEVRNGPRKLDSRLSGNRQPV